MLKPKNVIDREDKGEIVEAEGGGTMTKVYCTAIVLAAGSGKRMGTKVHKQYLQSVSYTHLDVYKRQMQM